MPEIHSPVPNTKPCDGVANLMPHTADAGPFSGWPSGTTGAGSPRQLAPRFSVRTIDVHGVCEHGAVPSTNASSGETNVTEVAAIPVGTGPPAGVAAPTEPWPEAVAELEGAAGDDVVAAADVVPPPLDTYPRTREVLETHTEAICARLTGDPGRELESISDDFVLALRADGTGSELAVSAALPLTAVAAQLGEIELLYPHPVASAR